MKVIKKHSCQNECTDEAYIPQVGFKRGTSKIFWDMLKKATVDPVELTEAFHDAYDAEMKKANYRPEEIFGDDGLICNDKPVLDFLRAEDKRVNGSGRYQQTRVWALRSFIKLLDVVENAGAWSTTPTGISGLIKQTIAGNSSTATNQQSTTKKVSTLSPENKRCVAVGQKFVKAPTSDCISINLALRNIIKDVNSVEANLSTSIASKHYEKTYMAAVDSLAVKLAEVISGYFASVREATKNNTPLNIFFDDISVRCADIFTGLNAYVTISLLEINKVLNDVTVVSIKADRSFTEVTNAFANVLSEVTTLASTVSIKPTDVEVKIELLTNNRLVLPSKGKVGLY